MKTISKKPDSDDDMIDPTLKLIYYIDGMEELILSPFGWFIVEEIASKSVWFVMIMPRMKTNLEQLKKTYELSEENNRFILHNIYQAMMYLNFVRNIRHQDIKPSNILIDCVLKDNEISNLKVNIE